VGVISLVVAHSSIAAASGARVCTSDTHQRTMLSQRGLPASDRVLALVEGNLPLYAVDITLDEGLRSEVTAQQMEIMRSVAGEFGLVVDGPTPASSD